MLKLSRGMLGDRSPDEAGRHVAHSFFRSPEPLGNWMTRHFAESCCGASAGPWPASPRWTSPRCGSCITCWDFMAGWLGLADILGSVGASLLAFWLFLPVAAGIGTLYLDRIASAVERRFYPWLPPPDSATLLEQAWDGIAVALKVLALNVAALILALLIPGLG